MGDPTPQGGLPDADLSQDDAVAFFTRASAPQVFGHGWWAVADREDNPADCPVREALPDKQIWTGGCTDAQGTVWEGTLTSWDAGGLEYVGFGWTRTSECEESWVFDGLVSVYGPTEEVGFDVALEVNGFGCFDGLEVEGPAVIEYTGTYGRVGDVQTWNGQGWVGVGSLGRVWAETEDEVIDPDICLWEAASGTTRLESGDAEVVFTYDGADRCQESPAISWSRDGEDMGEMAAACSTGRGGAFAALLAALLVRR